MTDKSISIYERLLQAGANIDNHQSDLYVEATPEVMAIIHAAQKEDETLQYSLFTDEETGKQWADLPFQHKPYWDDKQSKERASSPAAKP